MAFRKLLDSAVEMLAELWRNERSLFGVTISEILQRELVEGVTVHDPRQSTLSIIVVSRLCIFTYRLTPVHWHHLIFYVDI